MKNTHNLRIGDVLVQRKLYGLWVHVGVVIGYNLVLHNTWPKGEHAVTLDEFAGTEGFEVVHVDVSPDMVMEHARKVLANPKAYDLLSRNCEHTVNEVLTGQPSSPQIQGWMLVGICCVGVGVILMGQRK